MAAPDLLVWVDTEATGLPDDPTVPTVLEFAWTITDTIGDQSTPLRSVFSMLPMFPGAPVISAPELGGDEHEAVAYWTGGNPPQFVQDMHAKSGLTLELALAIEEHPETVMYAWPEIERLMLDDLAECDWADRKPRTVQLAGDGVGHYEHRFLSQVMPRIFANYRMHYRVHDLSVALHTISAARGGAKPDDVGDLLAAHLDSGDESWTMVEIGETHYDAKDWGVLPGKGYPGGTHDFRDGWARATEVPHRAGADVARTLLGHRLLPRLVNGRGVW